MSGKPEYPETPAERRGREQTERQQRAIDEANQRIRERAAERIAADERRRHENRPLRGLGF